MAWCRAAGRASSSWPAARSTPSTSRWRLSATGTCSSVTPGARPGRRRPPRRGKPLSGAQPRQPRGGRQGLRHARPARRRLARCRRGRPHRRRRPQRRRQVDAAAAADPARAAGLRPGHPRRRSAGRPGRAARRRSTRTRPCASLVVGDGPAHEWASDARVRDVLAGLFGEPRRTSTRCSTASSARCPAASGAGSRWPGRWSASTTCWSSTSRPTTSTSRASTGWRDTWSPAARRWWS